MSATIRPSPKGKGVQNPNWRAPFHRGKTSRSTTAVGGPGPASSANAKAKSKGKAKASGSTPPAQGSAPAGQPSGSTAVSKEPYAVATSNAPPSWASVCGNRSLATKRVRAISQAVDWAEEAQKASDIHDAKRRKQLAKQEQDLRACGITHDALQGNITDNWRPRQLGENGQRTAVQAAPAAMSYANVLNTAAHRPAIASAAVSKKPAILSPRQPILTEPTDQGASGSATDNAEVPDIIVPGIIAPMPEITVTPTAEVEAGTAESGSESASCPPPAVKYQMPSVDSTNFAPLLPRHIIAPLPSIIEDEEAGAPQTGTPAAEEDDDEYETLYVSPLAVRQEIWQEYCPIGVAQGCDVFEVLLTHYEADVLATEEAVHDAHWYFVHDCVTIWLLKMTHLNGDSGWKLHVDFTREADTELGYVRRELANVWRMVLEWLGAVREDNYPQRIDQYFERLIRRQEHRLRYSLSCNAIHLGYYNYNAPRLTG